MAGGSSVLIATVAAIIGLGVGAQILADRFQLPSIIFLIAAGLALGPGSGLVLESALVTRGSFGRSLPAIVCLSVRAIRF